MKIVSWNMGCGFGAGGYRKHHEEALAWLFAYEPDVALLQEVELVRLPGREGFSTVVVPTSTGRPTGNALMIRATRVDPIDVNVDGALVAAAKARVAGSDVTLVSAHVTTGSRHGHALARFVAEISRLVGANRFVVGGDFNASLHWPEYKSLFFAPMRAAGFLDTRPHEHEVQSYWGRGSTARIQDDHVFVDKVTSAAVRHDSWAVLSTADHRRWSDHGPVVLEVAE